MFGDVYIARFPFTDGTSSKVRPVLVLFELGDDLLICRITSALHNSENDVTISEWQAAGLLRPSVAQLDRLTTADAGLLKRKLGRLTENDREAVRNVWKRQMKL